MTEPTDKEQYLNIADQCAATATSNLAASILVDGGNGTLRQLLNDAADAIRAGWATPQPTQAQAGAVPLTDEQAKEVLKNSDLLDMFLHIGWYSAPRKNFDAHGLTLIRAVEAAHGIKGGQHGADT